MERRSLDEVLGVQGRGLDVGWEVSVINTSHIVIHCHFMLSTMYFLIRMGAVLPRIKAVE